MAADGRHVGADFHQQQGRTNEVDANLDAATVIGRFASHADIACPRARPAGAALGSNMVSRIECAKNCS